MDSHGNSLSFHVCHKSKTVFGHNPHRMPWLFHVIYPGFICFTWKNMTRILDKFKSRNEFSQHLPRKWWDFHRIWSHFWLNCHQKDMEKSLSHFLQGQFTFSNVSSLVQNVTWIFSCHFDGSLVKNDPKPDANPVDFLANAMEIPWFDFVKNPCHIFVGGKIQPDK